MLVANGAQATRCTIPLKGGMQLKNLLHPDIIFYLKC